MPQEMKTLISVAWQYLKLWEQKIAYVVTLNLLKPHVTVEAPNLIISTFVATCFVKYRPALLQNALEIISI